MAVLQGKLFHEDFQLNLDPYDIIFEHDTEQLKKRRAEIKAVLVHATPKGEELIKLMDELPNLKAIINHGVGVNHIDLEAARARGIQVSNTPDCLSGAVADFAFALLLASARNVVAGDARSHNPEIREIEQAWFGTEVHGSVLGIVGMGRIGLEIARRAKGFDMKVLYYNRRQCPADEEAQIHATYCKSLDALLREADFVVVAVPGGDETRKMFSHQQFSAMKETATFLNISRGSVVDQDALVQSLKQKKIAAAALDVTEPEPLLSDHPLLQMKNVVITPHMGSATMTTRRKMFNMCLTNLDAALQDKELPNRVA